MDLKGHRHHERRYQTAHRGGDHRALIVFSKLFSDKGLLVPKAGLAILLVLLMAGGIRRAKAAENLLYHNATNFKIPFQFDSADKRVIKSIELYVSEDRGETWRLYTSTSTATDHFSFRGTRQGEYWFAVRTLDIKGRYNPGDDKPILPDWRVVVDTQKPTLALEAIGRQGAMAAVRWEARDENLDITTLKIEYSQPGTGVWRPVPVDRLSPSGETQWDAGSANAIRVRASIEDKARNIQNFELDLSDGVAQRPQSLASRPESMDSQAPAPIADIASAGERRGILGAQHPREISPRVVQGDWVDNPSAYGGNASAGGPEPSRMSQVYHGQGSAADSPNRPIAGYGPGSMASHINLLNSPKFPLNYSVDDAGPNGPASVELWVTRDGGKNWTRWSEDADRLSPFPVDLGGEGFYGISIVARSLAGQGDEIPRSGSQAQLWVEVDTTPPAIVMNTIKLGVGTQSGKVLIPWRAEDRNFGSKPISLFYKPETSNQWVPIAENIENTGQYVWTPGPQVPPVFHIRIEAIDKAGNKSGVDTTNYEPVLFDRSRPKARILGLNSGSPEVMKYSNPPSATYATEDRPRPVSSSNESKPVADAPKVHVEKNLKPSGGEASFDHSNGQETSPMNSASTPEETPAEPPKLPQSPSAVASQASVKQSPEPPKLPEKPPVQTQAEHQPTDLKQSEKPPVQDKPHTPEPTAEPPKLPQSLPTELPATIPAIDQPKSPLDLEISPPKADHQLIDESPSADPKLPTPLEPE